MAKKAIVKRFEEWKGLHKGFTNKTRPGEYESVAQNARKRDQFDLEQVGGAKIACAGDSLISGLAAYTYLANNGAQVTKEYVLAAIGAQSGGNSGILHYGKGVLTVTYTEGTSGDTCTISFLPDETGFELIIKENGVTEYSNTYSTGREVSYDTLATLVSDVTAVTLTSGSLSISASKTSANGVDIPAAALQIFPATNLPTGEAIEFNYEYWEAGDSTEELDPYDGTIYSYLFRLPQFAALNNILYFALDNHTEALTYTMYKFDGLRTYRPGMPQVGVVSTADGGAGSTFNAADVYKYLIRYVRQDYQGRRVEGNFSEVITHTIGGSNQAQINVTIPTIQDSASTKYLARGAVVNGNQTGVTTITVNTGYTFKIGDQVYFYDGVTANFVVRTITDTPSSTTIKIDGAGVNVVSGAVISNNIRIEIYRTKAGGDIFYYNQEVPNNARASTYVLGDQVSDAGLSEVLVEPETITTNSVPPELQMLAAHQELLVGAKGSRKTVGSVDDDYEGDVIFWSDITNPEYWPPENNAIIPFSDSSEITGTASLPQQFIVFKEKSRGAILGTLADNNIYVEAYQDGIGAPSRESIARGQQWLYFCSRQGPQRMDLQGNLDPEFPLSIGPDVAKEFYDLQGTSGMTDEQQTKLYVDKAVGFYDYRYKEYHLFIPAYSENVAGSAIPNSYSKWWVYQERHGRWYQIVADYSVYNPVGGFAIFEETLYFVSLYERSYTPAAAIFREHNRGDQYDGSFNEDAIEFIVRPTWVHLNEPSIYKKFIRLAIESDNIDDRAEFSLRIRDYRHFNASTYIGEYNRTFSPTDTKKRIKLKSGKTKAFQPEFYNNTINEAPRISGFELEIAGSFEGQEIEK